MIKNIQFYSHLICIEFTACDKIKRQSDVTLLSQRPIIIMSLCMLKASCQFSPPQNAVNFDQFLIQN